MCVHARLRPPQLRRLQCRPLQAAVHAVSVVLRCSDATEAAAFKPLSHKMQTAHTPARASVRSKGFVVIVLPISFSHQLSPCHPRQVPPDCALLR